MTNRPPSDLAAEAAALALEIKRLLLVNKADHNARRAQQIISFSVDDMLKVCDAYLALREREQEARALLDELVTVANMRGDSSLPHPSDDPKLWTARMQEAWDEAAAFLAETKP